jgi:dihydroxyacetone synthase
MTQTNGVQKAAPSALPLVQKLSGDHDLVLKTFRLLIADLCQQFSGGHPGYVHTHIINAQMDCVLTFPL